MIYSVKNFQKWESGLDLYEFADSQKYQPIKGSEKKWIRETMVGVSELLFYQKDLVKRKIMGARLYILFKNGTDALGSCEVEKACVITVDDKYMDDRLVKLPKTLRDILYIGSEESGQISKRPI
ncbi:hypothetical protein BD770DRAFT_411404 [Pilaira anomala]|nr:hypothetical protein BD770DRAFT_411404 [Pilaira anomala]